MGQSFGSADLFAAIALGAWIGLSIWLKHSLFFHKRKPMPLTDGLPDYERMMSRSLSLWKEFLTEILNSEEPKLASESIKIQRLLSLIQDMRVGLPVDPGPIRPEGLWKELQTEMDFLHKRIVHSLPDREFAHRKLRVIEQLILDIQENVEKKKSPPPPPHPSP